MSKGYTQAIKAGNTIYVSGQVGIDEAGNLVGKGDCSVQAVQAFENLKRVLEAGGASLDDVVKITIFVKNFDDRRTVFEISRQVFGDRSPAGTMVVIDSLFGAELLLEVEAIAVI